MNVVQPALLHLSFAPKELTSRADKCQQAHKYLETVWDACTTFGMQARNQKLNLSTTFPHTISRGSSQYILRAAKLDRTHTDREHEAVVFEYQDSLGILIQLRATEDIDSMPFWQETFGCWTGVLKEQLTKAGLGDALPAGMIGESYIFRGLISGDTPSSGGAAAEGLLDLSSLHGGAMFAEDTGSLVSEEVSRSGLFSLPADVGNWNDSPIHLADKEFYLLDGGFLNGRRVTAVMAPRSKAASVDTWTVWAGKHQPAYFVRYLLHSSKVHFAARMFEEELHELRSGRVNVDRTLDEFFKKNEDLIARRRTVPPSVLTRLREEMVPRKIAKYDLITGMSRLRELMIGVQTAQKNLESLFPTAAPASAGNSLFEIDRLTINWLLDQLHIEIAYSTAAKERLDEGHQLLANRLEEEARGAADRLSQLILYQGAVLSSLVVALAAVQAFKLDVPWPVPVQWAMAFFLVAIALSLSPLVAHWGDRYNPKDYLVGGILGATGCNLAAVIWSAYHDYLPSLTVSRSAWVVYRVSVELAGFVIGWWAVRKLGRLNDPGEAQSLK
jgi:hypothetical protein